MDLRQGRKAECEGGVQAEAEAEGGEREGDRHRQPGLDLSDKTSHSAALFACVCVCLARAAAEAAAAAEAEAEAVAEATTKFQSARVLDFSSLRVANAYGSFRVTPDNGECNKAVKVTAEN